MTKFIVVFGDVLQVNPIIFSDPNAVLPIASVKKIVVDPKHVESCMNIIDVGSHVAPEQRLPEDLRLEFPAKFVAGGEIMDPQVVVCGLAMQKQDFVVAHSVDGMNVPCLVHLEHVWIVVFNWLIRA